MPKLSPKKLKSYMHPYPELQSKAWNDASIARCSEPFLKWDSLHKLYLEYLEEMLVGFRNVIVMDTPFQFNILFLFKKKSSLNLWALVYLTCNHIVDLGSGDATMVGFSDGPFGTGGWESAIDATVCVSCMHPTWCTKIDPFCSNPVSRHGAACFHTISESHGRLLGVGVAELMAVYCVTWHGSSAGVTEFKKKQTHWISNSTFG